MKKILSLFAAAAILSTSAYAIGGASGAKTDYTKQGKIGEVVMNPYKIAPLTAVIKNGGYKLSDVSVEIVPKKNGVPLKYKVANKFLLTHGGIPVFGLYPDYYNTIKVSYTKEANGKSERIENEVYEMYASAVYVEPNGLKFQKSALFSEAKITKVDPEFKDRLYFVNNITEKSGAGSNVVWNNPTGGALEWNYYPQNFIIDTAGDVRWYMFANPIYDFEQQYKAGVMMGFKQDTDGALVWGYGQRYAKYDIMGREIFNRRLPANYVDYSHQLDVAANGNYFLRVASANTLRPDGKNVRTVRDVIVEIDRDGNVVDDWRLYEILDPYRDIALKVLDQGAVCLNIDANKAGQTLSAEELAKLDSSDKFGDIVGTGAGRNWAHVNSVSYNQFDDSIIISSRHQNAIVKIGRDKKIKWILGAHKGWKDEFRKYLLQPVDNKGKKIVCEDDYSKCPGYENDEGGFDFTWTQHTAYIINEMSKKGITYITVFDNGDSRGMEQPAFATLKYSRAVVYKIDEKKMSVEQVWEYGKQRGHEWYSPVTSLTKYNADKNSIFTYSATAGANFDLANGAFTSAPSPYLMEFKYGSTTPSVEIQLKDTTGYQAWPFDLNEALSK